MTKNPTLNQEPALEERTDIHQALVDAVHESNTLPPMTNFSVRMHDNTKIDAMRICATNGTDLSTFLRKCTENLVRSYGVSRSE